jgi:sugar phosphate isomerase/epimerase
VRAEDDLPAALPLVVHCHLKDTAGGYRDWDFPAIGEGHVDFKKILSIFAGGGYAGPFSVEIEFQGEPWPALDTVNKAMKDSHQYLASLGLS